MPYKQVNMALAAMAVPERDWPSLINGLQRKLRFTPECSVVRVTPHGAYEYVEAGLEFDGPIALPKLKYQCLVIGWEKTAYYIEATYWYGADLLVIRDVTRRVFVEVCNQ